MSPAAVSARGLEKRFGPIAALRGIDLEIESGTALAVLGPNGAGKSTLLRIAAGLSHPSAGSLEIRVGGTQRAGRAAQRAQVGFVGHATLLYPELTARENLILAGRLYSVAAPDARADTLLEEEGLSDFSDRRAGTFSRGMAQRLAIARAIVHDPQLVLLDEPFTGLDHPAAERLAQRMLALKQAGRTLMVTTHDLQRASAFADAAIVIVRGLIAHRAAGDDLNPTELEAAYSAALAPRT